jgi:hypothetical protein
VYYQPVVPVTAALWLWGHNVQRFQALSIDYAACFAAKDRKYLLPASQLYRVRRLRRRQLATALHFNIAKAAWQQHTTQLLPRRRIEGVSSCFHVTCMRS